MRNMCPPSSIHLQPEAEFCAGLRMLLLWAYNEIAVKRIFVRWLVVHNNNIRNAAQNSAYVYNRYEWSGCTILQRRDHIMNISYVVQRGRLYRHVTLLPLLSTLVAVGVDQDEEALVLDADHQMGRRRRLS